jgi:hypothetical protein
MTWVLNVTLDMPAFFVQLDAVTQEVSLRFRAPAVASPSAGRKSAREPARCSPRSIPSEEES